MPGFDLWLHHFLPLCLSAGPITSLSLYSLTHKTGIRTFASQSWGGQNKVRWGFSRSFYYFLLKNVLILIHPQTLLR